MPEPDIQTFLTLLSEEGTVVELTEPLHVSPNEPDNDYIECAAAGEAAYLVTGDKVHLLPIGAYLGIRIVSPAAFLAALRLGQ